MPYMGGAKSRDRTGDPTIFSRVLYQLSYLGKVGTVFGPMVGDDGLEPPTFSV